jgi:hypothetical protein
MKVGNSSQDLQDAMRSMNSSEVVGKVNPKLWGGWANACE